MGASARGLDSDRTKMGVTSVFQLRTVEVPSLKSCGRAHNAYPLLDTLI